MHMAQQISHLPGVPLSMENQHELHASAAVGLYLPPGPAVLAKRAMAPSQREVFTTTDDFV